MVSFKHQLKEGEDWQTLVGDVARGEGWETADGLSDGDAPWSLRVSLRR